MNLFFDNYSNGDDYTGVQWYAEDLLSWLEAADWPMTRLGFGQHYTASTNVKQSAKYLPQKAANRMHRYGFMPNLNTFTKSTVELAVFPDFAVWPVEANKTVVVVHDLTFLHVPQTVSKANKEYLSKQVPRSLSLADHVIVTSNTVRGQLVSEYGTDNKKITTLPALPKKERFAHLKPIPKEHRNCVLSINTLSPRKNINLLIMAYCKLPKTVKEKHPLVVIGQSTGAGSQKTISAIRGSQERGENVVYLGYVDQKTASSYLKNAAVYAYPSIYEGFGMQLLEAAMVGTPIVCSDIPIFREVASDGAAYFDHTNMSDLSSTLLRILKETALAQRLSDKATNNLRRFSPSKNVNTLKKLLDK